MSSMKKTYETFNYYDMKSVHRAVEPADYSDDATDDQLKVIKSDVAKFLAEEEWTIVDGPAW